MGTSPTRRKPKLEVLWAGPAPTGLCALFDLSPTTTKRPYLSVYMIAVIRRGNTQYFEGFAACDKEPVTTRPKFVGFVWVDGNGAIKPNGGNAPGMGGLTSRRAAAHNGRTTTVIGNAAPRKICGFFAFGFRQRGPLIHWAGTGARQFLKIGARSTPGTKAGNRTNNRGRITAVVEPLRLPLSGRRFNH